MNPYIRKKCNFSLPKMDYIMLRKCTEAKHVTIRSQLMVEVRLYCPASLLPVDVLSECCTAVAE